jgi:hypothetical protein
MYTDELRDNASKDGVNVDIFALTNIFSRTYDFIW